MSSSGTVSGERWPLLTQFDQTAGVPEMSTTYNFTGTVYHWVSDIHILDGSDGFFGLIKKEPLTMMELLIEEDMVLYFQY